MSEVVKVSWLLWHGHQKRRHIAFFKNKQAAENFSKSLDEKAEEVELTEGLSMRDVC